MACLNEDFMWALASWCSGFCGCIPGAAFGPGVKSRPISGVENTADISKLFVYTQVSLHTFSPGNQYTDMLKINLLYYRPTNNVALTSLSLFYSAYFPHNPSAISTIFTLNIN